MSKFIYQTTGVCPREIQLEIADGRLRSVSFFGGCKGNALGIARLAKGMPIDELIEKLSGTICGAKDSSCPDQLAKALQAYKISQENK